MRLLFCRSVELPAVLSFLHALSLELPLVIQALGSFDQPSEVFKTGSCQIKKCLHYNFGVVHTSFASRKNSFQSLL